MNLKKNKNGVTLVEVLVTGMIGAVVAAATVTFVNISGRSTDEMAALQVMQQESSMINELFLRKVRGGQSICNMESGMCVKPDSTAVGSSYIRISYPNPNDNIEFKIANTMLTMITLSTGKTQNLSTRLCTTENPSAFLIQPFGESVQLTLTLEYARKNKNYTYTTTIGSARCKNIL